MKTTRPLRSAFRVTALGSAILLSCWAVIFVLDAVPDPGAARTMARAAIDPARDVRKPARDTAPEGKGSGRSNFKFAIERSPASEHRQAELKFDRPDPRPHAAAARSETASKSRPTLFVESPPDPIVRREPFVRLGPITADDADQPEANTSPGSDRIEARLLSLQRQVDRLSQTQSERHTSDLERAVQAMQHMQQSQRVELLERQIQELKSGGTQPGTPSLAKGEREWVHPPGDAQEGSGGVRAARDSQPHPGLPYQGGETAQATPPDAAAERPAGKPVLEAIPSYDAERLSLQIQNAEIAQVLEMLGQLAGLNILVGKGVTGTVTANLHEVTIDQALDGVLRSTGYVAEREERFVYVMTPADAEARKKLGRKLITKVYRPHYISVKDLKTLIEPLITQGIGKVAVTAGSDSGSGSGGGDSGGRGSGGGRSSGDLAGGDSLSQRDALLVQDYAEVIHEIDGIVAEMDVPPLQVVIEAMIMQVSLDDTMRLGVNFALLDGRHRNLVVSGLGDQLNNSTGFPDGDDAAASLLPAAGSFIGPALGLKYGFINGDLSAFVDALEQITDVNVIASPQVRVLNKQRAELLIGEKLGYSIVAETGNQTTLQGVEFLDVGTKLVLRPFIAPDGLIRMEIHPEQSTGEIVNNIPNSTTTELTTNVMVRDGTTIVLGGLIEETVVQTRSRIPFLGSLPLVGNAFGSRSDEIRRRELIVLITPRIVKDPADAAAGEVARIENERRNAYFRNHLSPLNRRNLARMYCEQARRHLERGELLRARLNVQESLRRNKNSLEALRLRDEIEVAIRERKGRWLGRPVPVSETYPDHHVPESVAPKHGFGESPFGATDSEVLDGAAASSAEFQTPTARSPSGHVLIDPILGQDEPSREPLLESDP